MSRANRQDRVQFRLGIGRKQVDRHHDRQAIFLHIFDVLFQIAGAAHDGIDVFLCKFCFRHAAMHLERPHRGDQHHRGGLQAAHAAFNVQKLFRAEVRAKSGFRHRIIGQLQAHAGRRQAVAAVGDVRKRTAVNNGRDVFQRLHQIGFDRFFQQRRHCPMHFQHAGCHRFAAVSVADHDFRQAVFQIIDIFGQAQHRHDLGGHGDVEAVLARHAMGLTAQTDHDIAQGPVVHVHGPPPDDPPRIDSQPVPLLEMIVERRRQQGMRGGNRVEIAGKMQIDVFHRHDLGIAAARRAALDSHAGAERRLTQHDDRFLAQFDEGLRHANGCSGLAFARRRRRDGRDQNQLAIGPLTDLFP